MEAACHQALVCSASLVLLLPLFLKKFLMWAILSLYGIFAILLLFYVLVFWPLGMWDLSSLTRDQTGTPRDGRQSLSPTGLPGTPLPPFLRAGTEGQEQRRGFRPGFPSCHRGVWSLCLEPPLLSNVLPLSLYPASASRLSVGGCYFVREAVGVAKALLMISEELRLVVVWLQ